MEGGSGRCDMMERVGSVGEENSIVCRVGLLDMENLRLKVDGEENI